MPIFKETGNTMIQNNIVLSAREQEYIISNMPFFELSYEKISHRKVFLKEVISLIYPQSYTSITYESTSSSPSASTQHSTKTSNDLVDSEVKKPVFVEVHIPYGKKYCLWMTHSRTHHEPENKEVCYLMEIDKHKQICRIELVKSFLFPPVLSYGTLLYGCIPNNTNVFVIENILFYKGVSMKSLFISQKLGVIENCFQEISNYINKYSNTNILPNNKYLIKIPLIKPVSIEMKQEPTSNVSNAYSDINNSIIKMPPNAQVHHVEIWGLGESHTKYHMCSYHCSICEISCPDNANMNCTPPQIINSIPKPKQIGTNKKPNNTSKVFIVMADSQFDIYYLYAKRGCNAHKVITRNVDEYVSAYENLPSNLKDTFVYYNTASIQTLKTSVFMNSLFRNIRENQNLDLIEDSDEEDDFQDTNMTKYVNLDKVILMECVYQSNFRKWVPVKVVEEQEDNYKRIVSMDEL